MENVLLLHLINLMALLNLLQVVLIAFALHKLLNQRLSSVLLLGFILCIFVFDRPRLWLRFLGRYCQWLGAGMLSESLLSGGAAVDQVGRCRYIDSIIVDGLLERVHQYGVTLLVREQPFCEQLVWHLHELLNCIHVAFLHHFSVCLDGKETLNIKSQIRLTHTS